MKKRITTFIRPAKARAFNPLSKEVTKEYPKGGAKYYLWVIVKFYFMGKLKIQSLFNPNFALAKFAQRAATSR